MCSFNNKSTIDDANKEFIAWPRPDLALDGHMAEQSQTFIVAEILTLSKQFLFSKSINVWAKK
jgi:hypothetical protein